MMEIARAMRANPPKIFLLPIITELEKIVRHDHYGGCNYQRFMLGYSYVDQNQKN